jgi:hypothetical protein
MISSKNQSLSSSGRARVAGVAGVDSEMMGVDSLLVGCSEVVDFCGGLQPPHHIFFGTTLLASFQSFSVALPFLFLFVPALFLFVPSLSSFMFLSVGALIFGVRGDCLNFRCL